ncbi:hypothetical protein OEZ85_010926 [Tetradesmus obliquus]|uniref:Methanethiol oxidase n=1 Tax=Tetradesmus obliquus TaxID=3088 RepID=A0ABY8TSM0_TETOB|nr:hypothetical protein OEZ85_010926 [Tetradesmus obliquus]
MSLKVVAPPMLLALAVLHLLLIGCVQSFPISARQVGFKPSKLVQGAATASSVKASEVAAAVPAATTASNKTNPAGAAPKQQNAPKRCNSKGFTPADGKPLLYLYVWAGVENAVGASAKKRFAGSNNEKDFVATIDVTTGSPCFGQVISEADVPTSGNEPHHVGLNINGTVLGVGGFNSWRYKQPSMYFFNVGSNPAKPAYISSITPKLGAITDDFFRLPNGGFLVSLMGSTDGGSPGRVAEVGPDLSLVAEHPRSNQNIDNFNPHGLALAAPAINRFITLDYVEYRTTFKPVTEVKYRTTARIWDTQKREVLKVIDVGPQAKGLMTARYIPNGKGQFLITAGHGVLYVLDVVAETVTPIFDFNVGDGHCVLSAPFKNGSRVLVSLYETDQVQLLDISDLNAVKVLQSDSLPKSAGPHATVLAPGDKLLAISTYYVQHDHGQGYAEPFTRVNERSVRLFTVADDGSGFKPHPDVPFIDFKGLFPHKGIARPHGMAFKSVNAAK